MRDALANERVLDFCWVGAGALVTKLLAEHGAEVIKVESRARPDNLRVAPPYREGAEGLDGSGYFASRNNDKQSFALNMGNPKARAITQRLVAKCSIVTNNFRPGVMERWGLGHDELCARQPSLIYLAMPMQGGDGPHRDFVGFGSTIAALSGLVDLSGRPDRPPVGTGTHYPDHIPNPGHALVALLAAIYERERTGEGRAIELSQLESTVNVLAPALIATSGYGARLSRHGNRSDAHSPSGVFACAGDDRWCALAARSEEEWLALTEVLERPEWAHDPRFATLELRKREEEELEQLIAERTRTLDARTLMERLQERGVPAAVVQSSKDLLEDPHLAARRFWHTLHHPAMGEIVGIGAPYRGETDIWGPSRAAPLLGEHTRSVAESLLEMSGEEVDQLVAEGVLA
ncbi:MAG TPA: CoA transferase [Microbacteriaceae bacterium]|jgi:benzylsuccinate CoA-transferase BbsF subunit|nr:CoA transferase [Microbacteriaceae bacterium]